MSRQGSQLITQRSSPLPPQAIRSSVNLGGPTPLFSLGRCQLPVGITASGTDATPTPVDLPTTTPPPANDPTLTKNLACQGCTRRILLESFGSIERRGKPLVGLALLRCTTDNAQKRRHITVSPRNSSSSPTSSSPPSTAPRWTPSLPCQHSVPASRPLLHWWRAAEPCNPTLH